MTVRDLLPHDTFPNIDDPAFGPSYFGDPEDGVLVDERGNRWGDGDEALDGPHEGTRFDRVPTHEVYWFAWSSFNPETEVYTGNTTDAGG